MLTFLFIGLLAGVLAGWLTGAGARGWIGNLVLGVAGSFVGAYLLGFLGLHSMGGFVGSLVTSTVGAMALIFAFQMMRRVMKR